MCRTLLSILIMGQARICFCMFLPALTTDAMQSGSGIEVHHISFRQVYRVSKQDAQQLRIRETLGPKLRMSFERARHTDLRASRGGQTARSVRRSWSAGPWTSRQTMEFLKTPS